MSRELSRYANTKRNQKTIKYDDQLANMIDSAIEIINKRRIEQNEKPISDNAIMCEFIYLCLEMFFIASRF